MFNIINNCDLNSPAGVTPQLYISTSTTSPADLHSSLEEIGSSALRLKSTFPNEVIYLEVPGETNTTTHEPWSLPREALWAVTHTPTACSSRTYPGLGMTTQDTALSQILAPAAEIWLERTPAILRALYIS